MIGILRDFKGFYGFKGLGNNTNILIKYSLQYSSKSGGDIKMP